MINLFYDNLSLNVNRINDKEKKLVEKYNLEIPEPYPFDADLHIENKDRILKSAIVRLQRELNGLFGKDIDIISYKNSLLSEDLLIREFYLSYIMRIGYTISGKKNIPDIVPETYFNKLPYRIDQMSMDISDWGVGYLKMLKKKTIGIFNTIDRKEETKDKGPDISRFSLPFMFEIYKVIPDEDVESHALLELSTGIVLSINLFNAVINVLKPDKLYRHQGNDYKSFVKEMLDFMRDQLYPHIFSIPFAGLRVICATHSMELLRGKILSYLYGVHSYKEIKTKIKEEYKIASKLASIINELYSSTEFSDYYYFNWILYIKSAHIKSAVGNENKLSKSILMEFIEHDRKGLYGLFHAMIDTPSIYLRTDNLYPQNNIKRTAFHNWYRNSDFISDYDYVMQHHDWFYYAVREGKLIQKRKRDIEDYGKDPTEVEKDPEGDKIVLDGLAVVKDRIKAMEDIFSDESDIKRAFKDYWNQLIDSSHSSKSHKYIYLNSSAMDSDKIYCIIQNDISHFCQQKYQELNSNH